MPLAVSTPVIGLFAVFYVILLITLGIATLRNGHWFMFMVGIFLPFFWIFGALMPPADAKARMA